MKDSDFDVSDKTSKYIKVEDGYVIEQDGKVVLYSESISGASRSSNYIWVILLLLFGFGFSAAGLSSYFQFSLIPFRDFSGIDFIPQGILLLFYGSAAFLLSFLIFGLIRLDIGSGKNTFDIEGEVVRLTRKGFPTFSSFQFNQQNILLVYPFSDVVNLELDITDGLNPTRIIFLCLKDGRRIPLTPSNQLNDLLFLEGRAIFIAKLLKVDLKLNNR